MREAANALMQRVREARADGRTMEKDGAEVELTSAYRIQDYLGEGRALKGYKLGLISPAKQEQMDLDTPIYGRVYAEMLLESPVQLSRFIQPRMEPELAVVLGDDVSAGTEPGAAYLAIAGTFLAVDFLDSVWSGYSFGIADVVADNASGGGFLLGERLLEGPLSGDLGLYMDGEPVAEGPLAVLENPGERLAWLAEEVGGLPAGHLIFLGSPAAAQEARPGTLELRGPQGSVLVARIEK